MCCNDVFSKAGISGRGFLGLSQSRHIGSYGLCRSPVPFHHKNETVVVVKQEWYLPNNHSVSEGSKRCVIEQQGKTEVKRSEIAISYRQRPEGLGR